jgi:hypothetical protein
MQIRRQRCALRGGHKCRPFFAKSKFEQEKC